MPPGDEVALDRELLEKLFEQLDAELEKKDATARIYVVGGARMTLGLREGRTTGDVDATFREAKGRVNQAVESVAEQNHIPKEPLAKIGNRPGFLCRKPQGEGRSVGGT